MGPLLENYFNAEQFILFQTSFANLVLLFYFQSMLVYLFAFFGYDTDK